MVDTKLVMHPRVWYLPLGFVYGEAFYNRHNDKLFGINFLCFTFVMEW